MEYGDAIATQLLRFRTVPFSELPDLDLYMDQVVNYVQKQLNLFQSAQTERLVTPAILSNSVKSGLIPRPNKKKYAKRHLAALIMSCTLKQVFPVQQVEQLLGLFNSGDAERFTSFGQLQDESLQRVAQSLPKVQTDKRELCELILKLALTANANRLAARLLLLQLHGVEKESCMDQGAGKMTE
jgi:hypothetical protein